MSSRSRNGCVTCKKRKKKCDATKPACLNCRRLHIDCGGYKPRLLFDDDPVREGIRRRGPARKGQRSEGVHSDPAIATATATVHAQNAPFPGPTAWQPSSLPELSETDAFLWDSYLNRFCKIYTTVTDQSSPFLSVIVPLAHRYVAVRHAVLALAALQLDVASNTALNQAMQTHQSQAQASVSHHADTCYQKGDLESIMCKGTTSVLLLIASKVSGHSYSTILTHLQNIRSLTSQVSGLSIIPRHAGSFKTKLIGFWKKMLSYTGLLADLNGIRSFFQDAHHDVDDSQDYPGLSTDLVQAPRFENLVTRINAQPEWVSTFEIDMWAGELDFMPSVTSTTARSLQVTPTSASDDTAAAAAITATTTVADADDDNLIREIYRTTLRIQHFKKLRDDLTSPSPNIRHTYTSLAYPPFMAQEQIARFSHLQIHYMRRLSPESRYDTSLLLPLGVAAPELTKTEDKNWVLAKLASLEAKLGFPLLRKCREQLLATWSGQPLTHRRLPAAAIGGTVGISGEKDDTFLWG